MADKFLDKVYDTDPDRLTDLYDDWAGDYDGELTENGYATPGRLARAMAAVAEDKGAPLLDFGCGTGLGGVALVKAGFTALDGCDVSEGMLQEAQAKRIYRNLWQTDASGRLPFSIADYPMVVAIGVISAGAAPAEMLPYLARLMSPGALLAFSFNDHTLEDASYMDALDGVTETSSILWDEMGDHIPGLGSKSRVFVLEIG
ncbi:MAG: methyltransferase [Pseudomonadota bacterium]|nr:methyltransferase [Pseudomonadota bacterium]